MPKLIDGLGNQYWSRPLHARVVAFSRRILSILQLPTPTPCGTNRKKHPSIAHGIPVKELDPGDRTVATCVAHNRNPHPDLNRKPRPQTICTDEKKHRRGRVCLIILGCPSPMMGLGLLQPELDCNLRAAYADLWAEATNLQEETLPVGEATIGSEVPTV